MLKTTFAAGLIIVLASQGWASHANPWASDDDDVQAQYHDANQAKSVDTPGEDEMLGVMTRSANGKLSDDRGRKSETKGKASR